VVISAAAWIEDLPKLGKKYGMEPTGRASPTTGGGLYQPQMHRVRKGELPWTNIDELAQGSPSRYS